MRWFEEATEVFVHARDPSKRVDAMQSERHVRVERDGELLAESRRPVALFETWLPTRWYLPPEDVRLDALTESGHGDALPVQGHGALLVGAAGRPTSRGPIPSRSRSARGSPG